MSEVSAPIENYLTLGPGTFTVGEGITNSWEDYIKSITIDIDSSQGDPTVVLSGKVIAAESTYRGKAKFTTFQTLKKGGLIDYSWENAGKQVPFTFTPKSGKSGAKIEGQLVVQPISIGGEAGTRTTSDVEWEIVGLPKFTPDAS
ncbi:hypothetical protein QP992_00320 [Corynebacterium ulcerans]|uniref:hypothetical protein n=1 Tax=Corynebacterium ulcerans TaxID=65058 RepID=UPI0002141717|nr:hypothetical protein [Corynebacterium ulcerans]AEG84513.1 hypothetical protein CULC22_01804 [Corynebacterium ulcerans BR-AD22]MDK8887587.1 hypothetical protein [Corynebacterium ulcerans]